MKKLIYTTVTLFLMSVSMSFAQTAKIQVIHNSADAAASEVDLYLDGVQLIDNFAFRTATEFINAPAGTEIDIDIAPANSTDVSESIFNKKVTLTENETYILVASGIVSASGYSPATPFDLFVFPLGREVAAQEANTDVLVFHGATDAPTVDVVEPNAQLQLVDNMPYSAYDGYLELPTADYSLQVQDETGTVAVAQFAAPLATLELDGAALVVVASGFLNPANNSDGPAFGLFAALPEGGDLVELPAEDISTAKIQVIHNSADEAAEVVDVYLNDDLLLDDFAFRTATPFVDVTAGVDFTVSIAPANSASVADAIADFSYNLAANSTSILVANGIISATGYNPAEAFDIYVYGMGREVAAQEANTDVLVFHGATDAPTVDVVEPNAQLQLVDNMPYSAYDGYLELPTADYSLQVQDETGTVAVAQFAAPLATLELDGAALVVVASGFLNPANNSDGPAFGLFAALPEGGDLVELPAEDISTAKIQVIHNSADEAAEVVDVYLNDDLLLDDFAFRTATPFVDVTAGVDFTVSIAPANSASVADAIADFSYNLAANSTSILVANGIISATGYNPAEAFDIYVYGMGREVAAQEANTDVLVFHGATDAPEVSVWEIGAGAGELFTFEYGDFAEYLELETADYILDILASGESVVSFNAPLENLELEGQAITVIASGFLNTENNSNGEEFGLFVALADGGELIALPEYTPTGIEAIADKNISNIKIFPNPTSTNLNIEFEVSNNSKVSIDIYNILGSRVANIYNKSNEIGFKSINFDVSSLPKGIYIVSIINGEERVNRKIQVGK